jgi:tetratricopeptide (TPR) repeat protein
VTSRGYAAVCLAELGDITEGRRMGEDAVRLAEEVAHPYSMQVALWHVGMVCLRQRDIRTALPVLERGLALCQSANIPLQLPVFAAVLGAAYALAGRAAEADPLLDQALEHVSAGSSFLQLALVLTQLSEALLLVRRVEDAGALASRLLALSHTYPSRGYQAHAYRLLGEVARHGAPPDVDQAATHYLQALALAEEVGMRPLQAHCHRGLGTLYATTGQREQARVELSAAVELYRAMEMTFWLPETEAALTQVDAQ